MIIHLINKKCIRVFANNKQIRDRKDEEEVYRRAGEDSPFCKSDGASGTYSHTSVLVISRTLLFGEIHEELPIAKATVSQHLKELKDAGLIQGEIETPKVKYCINKENWETAKRCLQIFLANLYVRKRVAVNKLFFEK